jgi:probable HAF family extracellular repeat protein
LTFAARPIGTRSPAKNITVTNILPIPVRLSVVTSGPFQSVGCTPGLGPHKSCTIKVTFAPTAIGPASGATVVHDGTPAGHHKVTLSGMGVASTSGAASPEDEDSQSVTDGGRRHRPRYRLVHLGTLGGPIGYGSVSGDGIRMLNHKGEVTSFADTAVPDPFAPDFCFDADCLVAHGFRWKHGVKTDLGALDNDFSSVAGSLNERGWIVGLSETGHVNPVLGGPEIRAVLWKRNNVIHDLGTLDGGSFSLSISVNDVGQVVGISDNGVPDPFSAFGNGVQMRTFLWEDGVMQDIGTLGGPDSLPGANCDNQRPGLIVGGSYTSFTPNDTTGVPTANPFLWKDGKMMDLGNLGGTMSFGQCANNRGDVIGLSDLPGDLKFHAFLWRRGVMKDLGTLGGDNSEAIWINDSGDIAGSADLPGTNLHDAVIWRHGKIKDLGTIGSDACSRGRGINSRGQVVGGSSDCRNFLRAFVWEEGGPMLDLNKLIAPGSGVQITNAININDRGEILAKSIPEGVTPIDDLDQGHLVLLIPCERHDHRKGCDADDRDDDSVSEPTAPITSRRMPASIAQRPQTAKEAVAAWRTRLLRRYHVPAAPRN